MRKLASTQLIEALAPIENADAIEVAKVLGWYVVVKKSQFKVGDMVVYCEIDSLLPEKPEFEFLRPKKFRIKTCKLRGQVSMGICFPMSILPPGEYVEDMDVTEIMGVTKYDPYLAQSNPNSVGGNPKGNFPGFLQKTDETRIQVLKKTLEPVIGTMCYISEKLDGSSCTFFVHGGVFGVCSRNLELKDENSLLWDLARKYNLPETMVAKYPEIAIQGEVIGPKIQGNKYKLTSNQICIFSVFDIKSFKYMGWAELNEIVQELKIPNVPILETNIPLHNDVDQWVAYSKDKSKLADVHREGIVIRSMVPTEVHKLGNLSFKVINPDFSLKYDE